jgi:hypothetical protein
MASGAEAEAEPQPQCTALDVLREKLEDNVKPNGKGEVSQFSAHELRALVHCIADTIEILLPRPQDDFYNIEFEKNPATYPPYRRKVIDHIKAVLPSDNQLLPILEEFNFRSWSGMFRNLDPSIESMVLHIADLLGFDGFCHQQGHFYRRKL